MIKVKINIEDLFNIPTAAILNPDVYSASSDVCIDSRKVKKNSIFFAIKGEKFDGHKFIKQAIKSGAGTIIINKNRLRYYDEVDATNVTVKDTTTAYGDLANIIRKKSDYKVISITGSNGKTGTKEILSTILSEKFNVTKTEANNNNHIGVPMTIFSASKKTEILILEHGTNHFGEIEYTAKIAEPDYALITNIGNGHLEFLEDKENVYQEKSKLFTATNLNGGKIFINADDKIISSKAKKYKNKTSFGFKGKPEIKGTISGYTDMGYPEISVRYGSRKIETVIPLLGEVTAKNVLASISVALSFKLTKREILSGIKNLSPFRGRLFPIIGEDNLIIDDTYNSNPESVNAAVSALKRIKKYRHKVILLGDMLELGNAGTELHKSLASALLKNKSLKVILIGKLMKKLFFELKDVKSNVFYFTSREKLNEFLSTENFENTAILVKGSHGMHMEEFIGSLCKYCGVENNYKEYMN